MMKDIWICKITGLEVEVIHTTTRHIIWKAWFSREAHYTLKSIFFKSMNTLNQEAK